MILAIDFDGVIHDNLHPVEGKKMGKPFREAGEALESIKSAKHIIIIHTLMAATAGGAKAVADWLEYYDIPYDGITAIKPKADAYIDDKAYRHTGWASTLTFLGVEE